MRPFDCESWLTLAVNATRDDVSRGGYVHDIYEAPFTGDFQHATDLLLIYRVFAPRRKYHCVCTPDHRVALGATIVQWVVIGPVAIEAAVRVIELESTNRLVSFTYATLCGLTERGIASFAVIRNNERATFEAQAWSRAGNWLTIIGRPLSRASQRAFTRAAIASFCSLSRN